MIRVPNESDEIREEADEVRRAMARLRRELDQEVRGLISVSTLAEGWRRHIARHPWLSLGAAFTAGLLIVPKRTRPRPSKRVEPSAGTREPTAAAVSQSTAASTNQPDQPAPRPAPLAAALSMAGSVVVPVVVRVAQSYAIAWIERWIAEQHQAAIAAGPPPEPSHATEDADGPFAY